MAKIPTFSMISLLPLRPTIHMSMCYPLVIPTWYPLLGYLEFYPRWSQMFRFSEKLGHLPRPSASRYFWWLAFEHQPCQSNYFSLVEWWNTVIFDRLNVMQSVFGVSIEFSMRTFLFKTNGSSADEQQQTISCNLHLDPVADVSSTEPDDCSCYSEEECSGKAIFRVQN